MSDERVESSIDLDGAVRELGDRIALIKAHIVGRERVAESNALPWADAEQREQVFAGMGAALRPRDAGHPVRELELAAAERRRLRD